MTGEVWAKRPHLQVINLCRDLSYQSLGYYASLLAEARGHRVIPSVSTLQDLTRKTLYGPVLDDLDALVNKALGQEAHGVDISRFEIVLHFGKCDSETLAPLARKLYEAFRVPLLRVEFRRNGRWRISKLRAGTLDKLSYPQEHFFLQVLDKQLRQRWQKPTSTKQARYDLAILHNPEEQVAALGCESLASLHSCRCRAGHRGRIGHAQRFRAFAGIRCAVYPRNHGAESPHLSLCPQSCQRGHGSHRRPGFDSSLCEQNIPERIADARMACRRLPV